MRPVKGRIIIIFYFKQEECPILFDIVWQNRWYIKCNAKSAAIIAGLWDETGGLSKYQFQTGIHIGKGKSIIFVALHYRLTEFFFNNSSSSGVMEEPLSSTASSNISFESL